VLDKFQCIDEVLRDRTAFDESSLVQINQFGDFHLESRSEDLSYDLHRSVLQTYGAMIT